MNDTMSMPVPRVSVLMAVYNEQPGRLATAIQSILRQTYKDFEFLIVDDGSESAEVRATIARAAADSRVRPMFEPHRGFTRSLNVGVRASRGQIICRQDSDDWSEPRRLAEQIAFLDEHENVALLGSAIALHREDGRFLWPMHFPAGSAEILSAFPRANPLCHGAVCIRKEALLAVGGYREEEVFDPASDYECFWRICDQFGCANLPSVLYHYRFTGGSLSDHALTRQRMSNYMAREFARERIAGRQTDFDTAFQHAEAIVHDEASDGTLLVRTALRALLAGYYGRGLRLFSKALAHRPLSLKRWTELAAGLGFVAGPTRVKKLMNGIISRLDA